MTKPAGEPFARDRHLTATQTRIGPNHVECVGAGPDVLLVHAGVADARMWDPQWRVWPQSYRVTRLDLRGFGRSDPPVEAFSHAGDVLAILDAAGIERAVLVGASYGGMVSLDLAASRPDRVAGLVLADASLPDHEWSAEVRAFGAAEDEALEAGDLDRAAGVNVEFWVPAASEQVRAAIREQQRNAFVLQVGRDDEEELLTDDLPSRLATIDVPTLVLVGERDHADFEAIADRLVAELPRARRETIPGAGHLPSLEQPEAFDAAVLPFLATLR